MAWEKPLTMRIMVVPAERGDQIGGHAGDVVGWVSGSENTCESSGRNCVFDGVLDGIGRTL
jgi:hypothetical protein